MLQPIEKTSLAGSVFGQLRGLILSGQLAPGDDLPAERQLSETLRVNRSAVREALKRLEQAGLVRIHHGGKTRVLDYRRHGGLDLMEPLVHQDPSRRADLHALRRALLPEVARSAATHATAAQIDRIEMLAGLLRTEDAEARHDLAAEFWDTLVDASANLAFRLAFNVLARTGSHAEPAATADFADLANALAAGDTRGAQLTAEAMVR